MKVLVFRSCGMEQNFKFQQNDDVGPSGIRRKSPDMVHRNGYTYITQKTFEGTRYLKCNMRVVTQCMATAKMPLEGSLEDFVEINHEHNHGPSADSEKKNIEFTEMLRNSCLKQDGNLKDIYKSAAGKDPAGAAEVPFRLVVKSMRKWRKQNAKDAHLNLVNCDDRRRRKIDGDKNEKCAQRKASDVIFKDGFAYVFQQIGCNPPVRYLKCRMKRLTNCTATGKTPLDEGSAANFVQINPEHNHPPEIDTERRTIFVKILKAMCSDVANKLMPVRNIYEAAVIRYPEGVGVVPYKTVQSSMFKWRRKALIGETCVK